MPTKHCASGLCKSDTRNNPDLKWAKFVQPGVDFARCKKWVHLMGRRDFEVINVKPWTYVCEKHFPKNSELSYYKVKVAFS